MTRRPDTIFLRGLEVECIIGFIEWERRIKQRLVIDLEMPIDCARAAATDEVSDTLDYSQVAARVTAFIGSSSTMLVETLAHRTAMLILTEFRLEWVRLSINKPGAVRGARDVGVSIERHRTDLPAAG
jgi:7,8-dihydroneopterin aldolase/epimerase/oxygenase